MKKVGILTFHYAFNYGAVLQAYALRKVINELPGCEAEIINYVPEGFKYQVYPENKMVKEFVTKRTKFEHFLNEKCMINSPMVHSIKETRYDYYCVGSDQVWNTDIPEAKNHAYFLMDLDDSSVKFSYAASIGMNLGKINKDLFQKSIPRFFRVGLREQSCIKKLNEICHINCVHNVDPTFLLLKRDYEMLIDNYAEIEEFPSHLLSYILYFWYGEGSLQSIELVNILARKYDLIVLHNFSSKQITRKMLCNDGGYVFDKGIEEFLWYVKHAAFVVTNSYHVGIFALIFERPVYLYVFEGSESRHEDMAKLFGIENRIVKGYIKPDDLNEVMEYMAVNIAIKKERDYSIKYLREVLSV